MRFHCLGIPHTVTSHEYNACAYTQKVLKFAKMMKARGHYIIHYGHEDSNLDCNEHVSVLSNEDFKIAYGTHDWKNNFYKFDINDHAYQTFYKNAIREVGRRKRKHDFILPFWGYGVKPICDAHPDLICVEPGIGYSDGHWAKWKIFESYAMLHTYLGLNSVKTCVNSFYDCVIPNYFDVNDFEYSEKKDDYFLYLGRVCQGKGIDIAIQVTEKIGAKLIIAGQNSLKNCGYESVPEHVTEVGYADITTRKRLMSRAKGAFVSSMYTEPFGGVQIEMLLSGTPTITTDWGAFAENNIHGVTGYRCRTFEDFCYAAENIDKIYPLNCRRQGLKFSLENIAPMYEKYFQDVLNVYTCNGWYERKQKPKIAIWNKGEWCMGKINESFKRHMSKWYDVDLYDWGDYNNSLKLWTNDKWREYDIITGPTTILQCLDLIDLTKYVDVPELCSKLVCQCHSSNENITSHFREIILPDKGILYVGINNDMKDFVSYVTPTPIDIDLYYPFKEIEDIKRVGFIGDGNSSVKEWREVKRPDMFLEICEKSNVEPVFLHGKSFKLYKDLYKDIDMLICCSVHEGGPQGILEAGACNIPVISTHVGYCNMFDSMKKFNTVDEAVEIISHFKQNPDTIKPYSEEIGHIIRTNFEASYIFETYWKPVFDDKLFEFKSLEIGTSNFDYNGSYHTLLAEPVKEYYDTLKGGYKLKAAVTHNKKASECAVYYIPSKLIEENNLPLWLKGCNSIYKPHYQHLKPEFQKYVTTETVKLINVSELFTRYNLKKLEYIKIDTEGHDCVVMEGIYEYYLTSPKEYHVPVIIFETNELSNEHDVDTIIEKFKTIGYKVLNRGYNTQLIKE